MSRREATHSRSPVWLPVAALTLSLRASLAFGAVQPAQKPQSALNPARQQLDTATAFERQGLLNEAAAQYSSAMTSDDPAVLQMAEAGLVRTKMLQQLKLAQADLQLGKTFEDAHQLDRALAAYGRAFLEGRNEEREAARQSILRVFRSRESFHELYFRGWVIPWLTKVSLGVLGVVILYVLLKILYWALKWAGRLIGSQSNRIEVADFEDSTDTGLGKGFPAVLRTVYRDRQLLSQSASVSSTGVALTFHSKQSGPDPVMGSAAYETFSEIKLKLAGVEVSELLQRLEKLVWKPHYTISGVIYRLGGEVRAAVTLSRYNTREMGRWDFSMMAQEEGMTALTDPMYEIIDVLLRDWYA